jgi:hypothetical protein
MAALGEDPSILASKRVVHVGGISDNSTVTLVRAAMIPFGNIKSVDIVSKLIFVLGLLSCFPLTFPSHSYFSPLPSRPSQWIM